MPSNGEFYENEFEFQFCDCKKNVVCSGGRISCVRLKLEFCNLRQFYVLINHKLNILN